MGLQGRRFKVDYANAVARAEESSLAPAEKKKGPGKKPPGCTSVTVGGLPESVTEKSLMKVFRLCGEGPRSVRIVTNEQPGECTGLAFVNFRSERAVDEAMQLNGTEL